MEHGDAEFARFAQAWRELVRAVARARGRGVSAETGGLTLAQALLLEVAVELDHPTVGDVAHAAGISSPSTTRMLQQLERKGMVCRRRSERDERTTVVTVTEPGRRALAAHRAHVRARLRAIFGEADSRLRPVLTRALVDMRGLVDEL